MDGQWTQPDDIRNQDERVIAVVVCMLRARERLGKNYEGHAARGCIVGPSSQSWSPTSLPIAGVGVGASSDVSAVNVNNPLHLGIANSNGGIAFSASTTCLHSAGV